MRTCPLPGSLGTTCVQMPDPVTFGLRLRPRGLWAATQLYPHTIYPAVREGSVQPGGLEAAAKFGYEVDRMA